MFGYLCYLLYPISNIETRTDIRCNGYWYSICSTRYGIPWNGFSLYVFYSLLSVVSSFFSSSSYSYICWLIVHNEWNWYNYFLNSSNHLPGIPIDWITFHFYASCPDRVVVSEYNTFFAQADDFITEVEEILKIRTALNPTVKIDIDEIGMF